ncbi:MAG: Ig domain-containing protein, partial [Hominicoprocola sp.]
MKKFLSLVLALVLTMSLVVVPANAAVTEVKLDASGITLYVNETKTLKATVTADSEEDDKTVTWESSDTSVATVSDGVVTAVAAGSATITAAAGGKTATCSVTVKDKYVLTAKADETTLYYNGTEAFKTATVTATLKKNGDTQTENEDYTIELSENSALLDTKGKTISVASTASSGQSNITVTVTAKVDGKEVATGSVKINVADRYTLEVLPASDKTVKVTIGEKETLTAPVLDDALSSQRIKAEEFTSL